MHNPLVSVIIPNYCHARYLDQRIQSVLDQTYQNFEIIILDDCSPDDGASRAVIEKYRSNPHVTHIEYNETNSGSTFKQWHKGFSLAKGELIWIAESDDACHESMLEKLVHEFELYEDCVIAYSTLVEMDTDSNLKRTPASEPTQHYSDMTLDIIGKWSEAHKQEYSAKYPVVRFLGFVDDLNAAIQGSTMIVPITVGSGIRMKILEASSKGVPFVSTTVGAEGIPVTDGKKCFLTDDPDTFVQDILKLQNKDLRQQFITNAHEMVHPTTH